ncbi:hypothetical protein [Algoriphagus sp. Y33]|uniref:hypothetical protein n=1 Tax=Algoriphagus sp. Y33 TaxID=2772483 RepID=UPI001CE1F9D9|nr:hypothetical protein [Algoriphagus sp. Y33]
MIGEKIIACHVLNFERAFYLRLSSGKILLFKLHANRSNVLLYEEGKTAPVKLFRNGITEDRDLDWNSLNKAMILAGKVLNLRRGMLPNFSLPWVQFRETG